MTPVLEKPALQYVVEEAVEAGYRDVLMVIGRRKRAIKDHFAADNELEKRLALSGRVEALDGLRRLMEAVRLVYARQSVPLGLGDAVGCAETFIGGEPFAILLGDDITQSPPVSEFSEKPMRVWMAPLSGVQEVPPQDLSKYGMVVGQEVEQDVLCVIDLMEKPTLEKSGCPSPSSGATS